MSASDSSGLIRNIQQSVQYREVIKQASDIIVYIDGQDYLVNHYLGEDGVTVPLNDFVNSWQSTYDIEGMVPSGSLTLTVAPQDDHLFRAPGGNNILRSMSDIRVFAKGYWLSPRGNTMYYQIFKGFISSITYTPSGKMTTITLSCFGALGMLERMQVEQNPSTMSSAPLEVTPYTSTTWNLDPYQSIAWVFLYSSMIDGFEQYSVKQAAMNTQNPYFEAVNEQYVAKWQAILYDIARDVHVYGAPNVNDVINSIQDFVKKPDGTNTNYEKQALGALGDKVGAKSESDQTSDQTDFYNQLRKYMPDMGIGSIQLLNGRVTSRMERLRYMTNLIGFEAYQDVDGGIVIKPPLYNLDVLNLSGGTDPALIDKSLSDLSDANNPFVVQLSEIITETESEDEAAVRLTRFTARGDWSTGFHWGGSRDMMGTAEDIDIQKLSQFGLRTEPPREAHWFTESSGEALYAFAASEMARANRGYRTYTITIPMRPEIKLGFPMYLPHKDIYGYIKSINMNWTHGGQAVTSITLDSLRRRPLLPETQKVDSPTGEPTTKTFMTSQPNLIMQWTKAAEKPAPSGAKKSKAAVVGKLSTLPVPPNLVVNQAVQMMEARQRKGNDYGINSDSVTHNWRVQLENGTDKTLRFDYDRPLGPEYYHALRTRRPYTDAEGYEVVGPFPWGRWRSLKEALTVFTIADALGKTAQGSAAQVIAPVNPDTLVLSNANAFLFTGDSSTATSDSASDFTKQLEAQTNLIDNFKVFELAYDATTATSDTSDTSNAQAGLGSKLKASAPATPTPTDPAQAATTRANTMLSGTSTSPSFFEHILNTVDIEKDAIPQGTPAQDQIPFISPTPFKGFGGGSSGGGGATSDF